MRRASHDADIPVRGCGTSDLREIDRWDHGVGWPAHPDKAMQRASRAAEIDGDMWLFDPIDASGADDLFAEFGDMADVVVGLDRHKCDSAAFANRREAPIYIASWITGVANELDATVERFGADLADSGFEAFRFVDRSVPPWQEVGLYHDGYDLLVVPGSIGTVDYFCTRGEHLSVHPMLRPFPPRRVLSRYDLDRLLVGHGAGVPMDTGNELRIVLGNARRNFPNAYARVFTLMLSN